MLSLHSLLPHCNFLDLRGVFLKHQNSSWLRKRSLETQVQSKLFLSTPLRGFPVLQVTTPFSAPSPINKGNSISCNDPSMHHLRLQARGTGFWVMFVLPVVACGRKQSQGKRKSSPYQEGPKVQSQLLRLGHFLTEVNFSAIEKGCRITNLLVRTKRVWHRKWLSFQ